MTVDYELLHQIRQHINRIEKQKELLKCKQKWLRLTAALDVLEDTSSAIAYYQSSEYLLQLLFIKLEELKKYCEETDQYFEHYGTPPREWLEGAPIPEINLTGESELTD